MEPAPCSSAGGTGLAGSTSALCDVYDLAICDLDGVVYRGGEPVPGAADHLRAAMMRGLRFGYATNNASRPPQDVADQLAGMGLPVTAADVVTSAQAVARLIARALPAGAPVLVAGGEGLLTALVENGLRPVFRAADQPRAVVQGLGPDVGWRDLCEAAVAVQRGVSWYAANTDRTVPLPGGRAPGNGTLVAAVAAASGGWPTVAGKPEPALFAETAERLGGRRPLVVGDRLDTDIEGAQRFGAPSLLVLTGVTAPAELLSAPAARRPTYLSGTLAGLLSAHPEPALTPWGAGCGGWLATVSTHGVLELAGAGAVDDALRAAAAAAWAHRDGGRGPLDAEPVAGRLTEMAHCDDPSR